MVGKIALRSSFVEAGYILIALFFFLYLGIGNHFGNSLTHPFPYGYGANDAFLQLSAAEMVHDSGNLKFMPPWVNAGFKDVVGFYPPALGQLSAALSYLMDIEVYDGLFIISHFLVIFSVLTFYVIVRKFSRDLAVLSLPLSVLYYSVPFFISMTFGELSFLLGAYFLLVFFWCLDNLEHRISIIALIVSVAGMLHSHQSEFIFAMVFVFFYSLWKFCLRALNTETVKKIIVSVMIGILLSLYFFIIFRFSFMVTQPYSFKPTLAKDFTGWRAVTFGSFGIVSGNLGGVISKTAGLMLPALLITGILLGVVYLLRTKRYPFIVAAFILIVGYTNLIGGMNRAFQTRFVWPIYFGLFLGAVFYTIIRQITKKQNIFISAFTGLCLLLLLVSVYFIPMGGEGLMNIYQWNSLKWLRDNTPEDSKIYFLYTLGYPQGASASLSHRLTWFMTRDAFVESVQKGIVARNYSTAHLNWYDSGIGYWKSLLNFGYHETEDREYLSDNGFLRVPQSRDICTFDYYVYDRQSDPPVISLYSRYIVDAFLKSGWFEEVYSNELVGVVKNNKPGENCLWALFQNETRE